jgi:hypothetical protein
MTVTNTAVNGFILAANAHSYMSSYYCVPGQCFPGYPVSGGYYSSFNAPGGFYAGGPSQRGFGPTVTATVVVPTVMGNNLPFGVAPANVASGMMVNPNTPYNGGDQDMNGVPDFTFQRGGSIRVTPGPNKFSGTMRYLQGPNSTFFQVITVNTPFTSYGYGSFMLPPGSDPTNVGEITSTGGVNRYRMTPLLSNKACATGAPPCGPNNYISAMAYYLHLVGAPWMTGMIEGYQPNYKYLTKHTFTGYDNLSPTAMQKVGGVTPTRIVSLVRPRLTHTYLRDNTGNVIQNFSAMRTWKLDVFFLPEPGQVTLLLSGIAGLVGLSALVRRRR